MAPYWAWLMRIDSRDSDARRRGRNVVVLALGMIVTALIFMLLVATQPASAVSLAILAVCVLIFMGVLFIVRRGYVTPGASVFVASLLLATLGSSLISGILSVIPFYLILPVIVASLGLRPWHIWLVLAVTLVGLTLTILALPASPLLEPRGIQMVIGGYLLPTIVALMSFLGARSTARALQIAQQARADAETAARALEQANTRLEATVAERTAALELALEDTRMRADQQARLLAEVEQQRNTIRELSMPVIPISATTLIMPLIGALDSTRLQQLQEQALQSLEHTSARYLVLDITGVPVVDTQVAQGLLVVVQAARLLGAEVMLVGIRPEVAQAIVGLGLSLQLMYTASDLQSALSRIQLQTAVGRSDRT